MDFYSGSSRSSAGYLGSADGNQKAHLESSESFTANIVESSNWKETPQELLLRGNVFQPMQMPQKIGCLSAITCELSLEKIVDCSEGYLRSRPIGSLSLRFRDTVNKTRKSIFTFLATSTWSLYSHLWQMTIDTPEPLVSEWQERF